jgi:hypothetical protein
LLALLVSVLPLALVGFDAGHDPLLLFFGFCLSLRLLFDPVDASFISRGLGAVGSSFAFVSGRCFCCLCSLDLLAPLPGSGYAFCFFTRFAAQTLGF